MTACTQIRKLYVKTLGGRSASAAMVAGAAASASLTLPQWSACESRYAIGPFWCMYAHTIVTSCTTITSSTTTVVAGLRSLRRR